MISAALLQVPMEEVYEIFFIVWAVLHRTLQPLLQYGKLFLGSKFLRLKGKRFNAAFLHSEL